MIEQLFKKNLMFRLHIDKRAVDLCGQETDLASKSMFAHGGNSDEKVVCSRFAVGRNDRMWSRLVPTLVPRSTLQWIVLDASSNRRWLRELRWLRRSRR